ncbi:MAG: formate/nitrite transporter family protein [Oscillospiraceae bacterium]|nr:formate/nitrite transporter family protein [Oscillospiraceae bacterium]
MRVLLRGFLAGILISIGCVIYLMCENKIAGSFLFSFGLFTILNMKLDLYTGKIGYLITNRNRKYVCELLIALAGNFLGTLFVSVLIRFTRLNIMDTVAAVTAVKLADSYISMFILAGFCGMLMFLGVDMFRSIESYIGKALAVFFAVMVFILSGFEHCIADMFYFNLAGNLNILLMLIIILGNTAGSLFISWCFELSRGVNKKIASKAESL